MIFDVDLLCIILNDKYVLFEVMFRVNRFDKVY